VPPEWAPDVHGLREVTPINGHAGDEAGYSDSVTQPEPLPEYEQRTDVHPIEDRPDVLEAVEDDTTAPGFPVPEAGPDDLTPRFREPL
jgi:hypothetical protein